MREEDSAHIGLQAECTCSGVEDRRTGGWRSAHEIGSLARVPDLRWPALRLSEIVPGKKIFPINTEERTHECRQKSPNDQLRRELLRRVHLFPEIPADFWELPHHITAGFSAFAGISLVPSLSYTHHSRQAF